MAGEKSKYTDDTKDKSKPKPANSLKENRLGKLESAKVTSGATPDNDASALTTSGVTSSEQIKAAVKKAGKAIDNSPRATTKNQKKTVDFDPTYDLLQISKRDPNRCGPPPQPAKMENLMSTEPEENEPSNEKTPPEKPSINPKDKK